MNPKYYLAWLPFIGTALVFSFLFYSYFIKTDTVIPFRTEKAQKRHITNIIKATGFLNPKDVLKIGSLVNGIIETLYVEENEFVEAGQLIAEIDDGKEDAELNMAFGALDAAQAQLAYQKTFLERQQTLFGFNQVSLDTMQQAIRDYHNAVANVEQKKAQYEQAKITFGNKKIYSPLAGIIIAKNATLGETVTLSAPATIIYTIAKNIKEMEAELEVDESTIGYLKLKTNVQMTFDTYPHKVFSGTITEISNNPIRESGTVSYRATVPFSNDELLFRPGMTLDARIIVDDKEDTLSLPSQVFKINRRIMKELAYKLGYTYQPINETERNELIQKDNTKTIWIVENGSFIERAVTIGTNDSAFYEITSGINGSENVIYDTIEPDAMKEFFGRFFGKGLSA